jgi:Spy/CpxP family protein refolding chaperone
MKRLFTKRMAATVTMLFILLFAVSSTREVRAQNPAETPQNDQAQENPDTGWRNQLNLTPDQITKIRTILEQNKAERQAARQRVNQAQRALDQAIYADAANKDEITQRTHELSEAQTAEVRLRAATELKISRVLTPEQLNKFRTIRQERAAKAREARRLENGNQQKTLNNNKPLGNGVNQQTPEERRNERRLLRRNGLPRKIRP